MRSGFCKFGSSCSYRHEALKENTDVKSLESEIIKLKETLSALIAALQNKENEIKIHEQRITCLESNSKTFQCTQCDYVTSTSTALKTHITKKHKPESLRDLSYHHELEVSLTSPEREEEYSSSLTLSPSPCTKTHNTTFTCLICDDEYMGSDNFKNHMASVHKVGEDTNKCFICGEVLTSTHGPKVCDFCIDNCRPEYLKVFI
jgi:hypothetical protein